LASVEFDDFVEGPEWPVARVKTAIDVKEGGDKQDRDTQTARGYRSCDQHWPCSGI
jgi:hypothetical protein